MFMVKLLMGWHHFRCVMATSFILVGCGTMTGGWAAIHTASSIWHNMVVDFFADDRHFVVLFLEVQKWGMGSGGPPRITIFRTTVLGRFKGGFQFGCGRWWWDHRRLRLFSFA